MDSHNNTLDLNQLDLSILFVDLGSENSNAVPEHGFWHHASCVEDMALVPRKIIKQVHVEKVLSPDYLAFAEKIADNHKFDIKADGKPEKYDNPVELDDQLAECTPQFILRNIPKIEHYYDLERSLPFNISDMPLLEATDLFEEIKTAHLGPIEFIPVEGTDFIKDFRGFLEEIFYMCPWDQITRQAPDEDSPWNIKYSVSKFSRDLLSRKNTLFIFSSEGGMTTMKMKDYKPGKVEAPDPNAGPIHGYGPG